MRGRKRQEKKTLRRMISNTFKVPPRSVKVMRYEGYHRKSEYRKQLKIPKWWYYVEVVEVDEYGTILTYTHVDMRYIPLSSQRFESRRMSWAE